MKKLLCVFPGLLIVFVLIIIIKTITFRSMQIDVKPVTPPVFRMESLANLSKALTYPTISHESDRPVDTLAFRGFHQFLAESYPLIHATLKKEVFSEFTLLFTWEGKTPALKPVILISHMDVVPAEESDIWENPPFSGANDGTFIWGRGAVDLKGPMISILEAVEQLIKENYVPEHTIYLAIGHDEEISGYKGARVIADTLKNRGIEAEFILDEGMIITRGIVPMISKPVASIGISEKGYVSVALTVGMEGGHSSYPQKESAITVLNKSLHAIINRPMKADIAGPVKDFIRYNAPEMPFVPRAIFANQWLFKGIILKIFERSNAANATIRTTGTVTILKAGVKDNLVPVKAEAVINFRILPGQTSGDVFHYLRTIISDDRVNISAVGIPQEPSPISPVNAAGFDIIHTTIRQVFPEVMVNPALSLGANDSRHFVDISRNIYRFTPVIFQQEDLARMHGMNERMSIGNFRRAIGFYYQLIKNS